MEDIQIFDNRQFGQIRATLKNGEPLFVVTDVCTALDVKDTNKATTRLDEDELTRIKIVSGGQGREVLAVTEPGLYALVLGSRKPEAKAFKRWVTHEIIPSIRKTGGYFAGQESMSDADLMAKALLVAQRQIDERNRTIERMKPKEIFADAVSASHTSILMGDMAKLLKQNGIEVGQRRLFEWMREHGYLIKQRGGSWNMPSQRSMEKGLFEVKETAVTHSDGHISISRTVKVTGRGQVYFINAFLGGKKEGIACQK